MGFFSCIMPFRKANSPSTEVLDYLIIDIVQVLLKQRLGM